VQSRPEKSAIRNPQSEMKTIVIGGQARDIGKTTVAAGIIAALPEFNWTAIKITGFGPEETARYGNGFQLQEEHGAEQPTDSSRFLQASARRAFWLRVPFGKLGEAMPAFCRATAGAENLIVESNSILEFVEPDLYLVAVDSARSEFKQTARRFLDRADAFVEVSSFKFQVPSLAEPGTWNSELGTWNPSKPVFLLDQERRVTKELADFIRASLEGRR